MYASSKLTRAALAGLAMVIGVTTAAAQDGERRKIDVHYGDLDLSSARGVERLQTRIATATRRVCTQSGGTSLAQNAARRSACIKESLARSDRDVQLAIAAQADRRYAARDTREVIGVGTR